MAIWSSVAKKDHANQKVLANVARKATHDDWETLQSDIRKLAVWDKRFLFMMYMIPAGLLFFLAMASIPQFISIGTLGFIIIIFASVISPAAADRLEYAIGIYHALVEAEFRTNRRLLPVWFDPGESGYLIIWPYRTRPSLAMDDWRRMFRSMDATGTILAVLLMIFATGIYLVAAGIIFENVAIIVLPAFAFAFWGFRTFFAHFHWSNVLMAVEAYEDMTGERVVPPEYRAKQQAMKKERARYQAMDKLREAEEALIKGDRRGIEKLREWNARATVPKRR
jgi:hypothetical protein